MIGQASVAARAPYDFVGEASDSASLAEYRDHSEFAVINFKKYKQPVLINTQWQYPAQTETLGSDSLLLASTTTPRLAVLDPQYQVVDVSNPANPATLGTIEGVQERLERKETGTVFFLGRNGLTVLRRPNVEKDYRTHEWQLMSN